MVLLDVAYTAMGTNLTRQYTRVVYHSYTEVNAVHIVHCITLYSMLWLYTVDCALYSIVLWFCTVHCSIRQAHCQYYSVQ